MTPSEAPKALQASECSELLDPTRANCWISAQHQPGKFIKPLQMSCIALLSRFILHRPSMDNVISAYTELIHVQTCLIALEHTHTQMQGTVCGQGGHAHQPKGWEGISFASSCLLPLSHANAWCSQNACACPNQKACMLQHMPAHFILLAIGVIVGTRVPQKFRDSHWCVPFTATFSKRRKIGALWSEHCDSTDRQCKESWHLQDE